MNKCVGYFAIDYLFIYLFIELLMFLWLLNIDLFVSFHGKERKKNKTTE